MDRMKFRKKPVVIEAVIFDGKNSIPEFELEIQYNLHSDWKCQKCGNGQEMHGDVKTLEGNHIACPGDYIIEGIKGEHYPCKPDIFEKTYEKVE